MLKGGKAVVWHCEFCEGNVASTYRLTKAVLNGFFTFEGEKFLGQTSLVGIFERVLFSRKEILAVSL